MAPTDVRTGIAADVPAGKVRPLPAVSRKRTFIQNGPWYHASATASGAGWN